MGSRVRDIAAHVRQIFDRIDELEPTINAFVTLDRQRAITMAEQVDPAAPLAGLTVAVKDNLDVGGLPCRYGSELWADRIAERDGASIAQLRAAGAVIVGKTMLAELACGTTGTATPDGDTVNPWRHDRMTGGSSSGSAAAVAASMVDAAIGSDTSCSIRLPAAHCGIVGLKPTHDRISRDGLTVCASSLDHIGPMTRDIATAAAILKVMQVDGHDDPTTKIGTPIDGLRIATLGGEFLDECDPDIRVAFDTAIEALRSLGVIITELNLATVLGSDVMAIEHDMAALAAEMLDRYGKRVDEFEQQGGEISPSLRHWFDIYETITPADRARALNRQKEVRRLVESAMAAANIDVLACPTTRVTAGPRAGASELERAPRVLNCTLFSVTGQPSLTAPCGFDRDGLPIGILLTGRVGADSTVLQVGHAYEGLVTTPSAMS